MPAIRKDSSDHKYGGHPVVRKIQMALGKKSEIARINQAKLGLAKFRIICEEK